VHKVVYVSNASPAQPGSREKAVVLLPKDDVKHVQKADSKQEGARLTMNVNPVQIARQEASGKAVDPQAWVAATAVRMEISLLHQTAGNVMPVKLDTASHVVVPATAFALSVVRVT
jgi:hypothetical protein